MVVNRCPLYARGNVANAFPPVLECLVHCGVSLLRGHPCGAEAKVVLKRLPRDYERLATSRNQILELNCRVPFDASNPGLYWVDHPASMAWRRS